MKENYIKVIRAACVKANPEIMELKPGCMLERYGPDMNYNIIGLDVSLVDILLASECTTNQPRNIVVSAGGFFEVNSKGNLELVSYWNLRQDSLTDQSEETLKFIAGLLE